MNQLTALDLLVLALATWRLAYMFALESGPWRVFERIRQKLPMGGLMTCIYCLSVWMAALTYVLWLTPGAALVWILAASGGAMLFWRQTGGMHVQ